MAVTITRTANPAGVSASSNVATYTDVAIGTAAPNRIVVVTVASELASTPIASCTLGGSAMDAGTQGNGGALYARTFYLLYPTGTTATVAVTFTTNSPSSTQNHIAVYSVTDAVYSSTGADSSLDMDVSDPLTTGSTTIAAGGGMIAVAGRAGTTGGQDTWANLTEDLDVDGGNFGFTTATSTTAGTATRTCTATTNGEDGALSWLIFTDNSSPTTALNSPADTATGVSTTPVLDFTGTDADSDSVRYEVQVNTTNTFNEPTFRTATQNSSSTGTAISVSAPTGTTTGDLVKVIVQANGQTTIVDNNGSTPFTEQVDDYKPNTTEGHTVSIFSRVIQGGDPSTYNFTSGASGRWGVVAICITGTTTPVDDVAPSTTNATNRDSFPDGNSTSASISTNTVGAAHIVVHCWDTGAIGTIGTPSGYTLLANANGGGEPIHASYKILTSVGSTGTTVATNTEVSSYIAFSFSVKLNTLIDAVSGTDAGFANPDTGGDTDPFNSGENIQYTVQSALTASTLYYWRVRGIDPSGSNSYGAWATTRSFTTASAGTPVTVNAGVQSATFSQPAITVTPIKNITVSPSVQSSTFSQPTPTITTTRNVTVSPSVQSFTASQPSIQITVGDSMSAGVQSATFSQISPTVTTTKNPTVSLAVQSGVLTQPTPTITATADKTVSPNVQSATFTQQNITVTPVKNVSVAVGAQSATFSQQSIGLTVGDGATPSVQSAIFSQISPTITTVQNRSVSTNAQSAVFTAVSPTVSASTNKTVSPSVQSAVLSQQSPTITPVKNVSTTPSVQSAVFSQINPTVTASSSGTNVTVNAAVQSSTFSQPTPTVTAIRNVTWNAPVIDLGYPNFIFDDKINLY